MWIGSLCARGACKFACSPACDTRRKQKWEGGPLREVREEDTIPPSPRSSAHMSESGSQQENQEPSQASSQEASIASDTKLAGKKKKGETWVLFQKTSHKKKKRKRGRSTNQPRKGSRPYTYMRASCEHMLALVPIRTCEHASIRMRMRACYATKKKNTTRKDKKWGNPQNIAPGGRMSRRRMEHEKNFKF